MPESADIRLQQMKLMIPKRTKAGKRPVFKTIAASVAQRFVTAAAAQSTSLWWFSSVTDT